MKISIVSLLLLIALAGCSSNNTTPNISKSATTKSAHSFKIEPRHLIYLKGVEEQKNKRYAEAARYYKKAAGQGHYLAQLDLSALYFEGKGVPKDYKKVFYLNSKILEKAPESRASFNLGQLYRQGLGVKKDYKKAIAHYKVAAKQGSAAASNWLGIMHSDGTGVKVDKNIARGYYIDAATKGNLYAANNLGALASKAGDYKQARQWYKKAADKGNKTARENLKKLGSKGY